MTPSEALSRFKDAMTDVEMHQALRAVEDGGCQVYRCRPNDDAASTDLWKIRLSNPAWTGPHDPENGVEVPLYEQHADSSWHMVE